MKSLFLTQIKKPELVSSTLTSVLPGQQDPWLLLNTSGDAVAYFHVDPADLSEIQADISGRHYDQDKAVVNILQTVSDIVGGKVTNEDDAEQGGGGNSAALRASP